MSVSVSAFLKVRRDRALASILGHAERELYPRMSAEEQRRFRQKVLDSLQSYHDSALDLFKGDDDGGTIRNEAVIELLQKLHSRLDQLDRARLTQPLR